MELIKKIISNKVSYFEKISIEDLKINYYLYFNNLWKVV